MAIHREPLAKDGARSSGRATSSERVVAVGYYVTLTLMLVVGGGWCFLRLVDVPPPGPDDRPSWQVISVVGGLLALLIVGSGLWLRQRHRRRFWFGTAAFACLLPLTLGLAEWLSRSLTPDWPASALHGVAPALAQEAWGHSLPPDDVGFNRWGQRDRERTVSPPPDVRRIAFLGDSFLEESTRSVAWEAERRWAGPPTEFLNLGISSTQPDEYFYRLRHVALPLGCQHCVVWLFSGNDFVDEPRTLTSWWGVCAVAPRPSLLDSVGCQSLNYLLTNRSRPVIQAWFAASELAAQESAWHDLVRTADDDQLRRRLLADYAQQPLAAARLESRLHGAGIPEFFQMLRAPDAGRFRSYYLTAGVWSAATGGRWPRNPETQALHWVEQMQQVCQRQQVKLTVVVIPEAFQVDRRMQEQWSPLCDMSYLTGACREAAERFCEAGRQRGLDVLDLHPVFDGVPGTYLNLDGHWSDAGVELAAAAIVKHLENGRE